MEKLSSNALRAIVNASRNEYEIEEAKRELDKRQCRVAKAQKLMGQWRENMAR